ncbi:unnamed protein product [Nezara viridula]|uniref:Neuropeptide n=1 Tax=Nezara viridula TaxID=85310 RepID=A0A9P0MPZ6_NEZVI|nr:unnamed protein product [Nezara viridula]
MRMSVIIIIFLCIQRSLTIEPVNKRGRINNGDDEAKEENGSKDQSVERYDTVETEYEDEDLADSPDIDLKKSSINEAAEGEKIDIVDKKTSNYSLPSLQKLQKIMRMARAALPRDNSSKIEEVESDLEEDDEFEDTDNNASTEEQEEAEIYEHDNFQPTDKEKIIENSERSKRQTINAKKGTVSSSPDLIEIGDDESLNENYGEDYGSFFPTRKERMTVRTRQRRITSKGVAHREILPVSTRHSGVSRVKDNVRVASDNMKSKQMIKKKSILHLKKGKLPKTKEKTKSGINNGESSDFDELKKAYNSLVCSVENFMGLANKTMMNKADENGVGIVKNGSSMSTTPKNDSSQTTIDYCTTSTNKFECVVTTCDDSDFEPGERIRKAEEDEDINSNMKKKYKGLKMEYPSADDSIEKAGAYVYNDYDSVDPSEYDMNVSVKLSSSPSSVISRSKQSTDSLKDEKTKKMVSAMPSGSTTSKDVSSTSRSISPSNEATKEPKMMWTTFHYETKIKLKPSKRQPRRMSTEYQKILSRRKYHYTRRRGQQDVRKEPITRFRATNYPIMRNIPPSHDGDTEIIEVEYV